MVMAHRQLAQRPQCAAVEAEGRQAFGLVVGVDGRQRGHQGCKKKWVRAVELRVNNRP